MRKSERFDAEFTVRRFIETADGDEVSTPFVFNVTGSLFQAPRRGLLESPDVELDTVRGIAGEVDVAEFLAALSMTERAGLDLAIRDACLDRF